MGRRVLSVLLLPCVLLTQSAAVLGHAHAGQHLPGHDPRPHIHLRKASHDHGSRTNHCPGHSHGGRHHHGDGDALSPEPPSHHDSDAFYVAGVEATVGGRSGGPDLGPPSLWLLPPAGGFTWPCLAPPPRSPDRRHPPPGDACPLFVRHLHLLI